MINECSEMETPNNCLAIEYIAPLPLHTLLNVDKQMMDAGQHTLSETENDHGVYQGDHSDQIDHNCHSDYSDLFEYKTNEDGDELSLDNKNQPSSSLHQFGTRESELLMQYLTHVQLPGLTRIDQMHLMAVTDCVTGVTLDTDSTGEFIIYSTLFRQKAANTKINTTAS